MPAAADFTFDPKATPADPLATVAPTEAPAIPSRAADTIALVDNETGLEQDVPLAVWAELGIAQKDFTVKADKPAELK